MTHRTSRTRSFTVAVTPTKLLESNPDRVMYSIQNLDAANYIAYGPNPNIAALGTANANEGFHVVAGQVVSDDMDTDEVYAIANTAAVIVTVTEITEVSNPRSRGRMSERESRREGSRAMI